MLLSTDKRRDAVVDIHENNFVITKYQIEDDRNDSKQCFAVLLSLVQVSFPWPPSAWWPPLCSWPTHTYGRSYGRRTWSCTVEWRSLSPWWRRLFRNSWVSSRPPSFSWDWEQGWGCRIQWNDQCNLWNMVYKIKTMICALLYLLFFTPSLLVLPIISIEMAKVHTFTDTRQIYPIRSNKNI